MELLSALPSERTAAGKLIKMGLFFCAFCQSEVTRPSGDGNRNRSCGCARHDLRATHGLRRDGKVDPIFWVWNGMKARCYNSNHSSWDRYGGRGIVICDEWLQDPELFYSWARANGWRKGLEVDRRENDDRYSPDNCRIVLHVKNCQHRVSSKLTQEDVDEMRRMFSAGGVTKKALGDRFGVTDSTASKVINNKIWIISEVSP